MFTLVLKLKDSFTLNFVFLLLFIFILKGWPVPSGNEYLYLLLPVKYSDPNYLLNDWTFSQPWTSHFVFNVIIGFCSRLVSLDVLGWVGRITCWVLLSLALFRLGTYFRIPLPMITFSISMWLLLGQSIVGGEWIFGGFEAKTVAYVCVLFGLDRFLKKQNIYASILLGLAFSFHPIVGLWSGLAIGLSIVVLKYPFGTLLKVVCLTTLFALPGIFPLISIVFAGNTASPDEWRFFTLIRSPHHLDPFSWPKRDIVSLYVLMLFNFLHFRKNSDNQGITFLVYFQLFLCLFFSLGLFLRGFESYSLLKFAPARLFPLFALLFFFFHLMNAYQYLSLRKPSMGVAVVGFLVVMSFNNPFGIFIDQARNSYLAWQESGDDIQNAFEWLAKNTPNGSIAILPPWRRDSFYVSQRAHIADWNAVPVDRLMEWHERIDAMLGEKWLSIPGKTVSEKMESAYSALTETEIAAIREKYGGDYLVSKGSYTYPRVFKAELYSVYSLKKSSAGKDDRPLSYHVAITDG